MTALRRLADWTFRNRLTGAITVGQWPNLPLWLFLGISAVRWSLDRPEPVVLGLRIAAGGTLAWWAVEEVLRGVNPWRRGLGAAVLSGQVASTAFTLYGTGLVP
ncbi:hypothetical protein [uncultured Methylobacterium sp.]|uniref:hypothetical protein n=1 Tax=uncultured Methylobacterium sp. TaxID=157278 RepID=UPI0035C9CD5E